MEKQRLYTFRDSAPHRPAWYQDQLDAQESGTQKPSLPQLPITQPQIQLAPDVSEPGDALEREAEEVAESVVEGGEYGDISSAEDQNSIHRKACDSGCECEECKEKEVIQRSAEGKLTTGEGFASELNAQKGRGTSLPNGVRTNMEGAMGADFSGVKVHTDDKAAKLSSQVNAKAFTHGSDIYFKDGAFDTSSREGNKLIAHELTHVVQQGGGEKIQRNRDDEEDGHDSKTRYRVDLGDFMGWEHIFSKQFVGIQFGSYWNAKTGRFVSVNIVSEVIVDERVENFSAENAAYASSTKYNGPIDSGLLATNGSFSFAIIDTNSGELLEEASLEGTVVNYVNPETGESELKHHEIRARDVCEKSGNFAHYIQFMKDYGKTHRGYQGMVTPNAEIIAGKNAEDSLVANDGLALGSAIVAVALAVGNAPMTLSIGAAMIFFGASVALPRFQQPLEYTAKINYVVETASYAPMQHEYSSPKNRRGFLGDSYHGNYGQIGEPEFDGIADKQSKLLIEMPEWMPRVNFRDMKKYNK